MPSAPFLSVLGELTPDPPEPIVGGRSGDVLIAVPFRDACGEIVGVGISRNEATALNRAAFLAAAGTVCGGLPVDGLLAGQFAIVDADPSAPFTPFATSVPKARVASTVMELLHIEECLQDPTRYVAVAPVTSLTTLTPEQANPLSLDVNPESVDEAMQKLRKKREHLLNHLARMFDLDFHFGEKGEHK